MDQKQMLKQMLEFNQTTFNNAFNTMTLLQDQLEGVAKTMLEQATWLPAEGRQAIENGTESYKSACQTFKQQVDDSYKQVEKGLRQLESLAGRIHTIQGGGAPSVAPPPFLHRNKCLINHDSKKTKL